jgi:anti-sigma regulatory factor (Ser/Thr protein kinase)
MSIGDGRLATRIRHRAANARPAILEEGWAPVSVRASWQSDVRPEVEPVELTLPRDVEAPGLARSAVGLLARELEMSRPVAHTLVLLVSEIVSNAVLHSTGPDDAPIGLTAAVLDDVVRVTVTDAGDGFVPGERDPERVDGGYGLYLVAKAASSWGVDPTPPTSVWFEMPLEA